MRTLAAALFSALVALAARGGAHLDEVSAIQVEVVQFAKANDVEAPNASEHEVINPMRTNVSALPSPVRQRPTKDSTKGVAAGIIHTRGHFNSLIVIIIFVALASVSITFYCCVAFNHADEDSQGTGGKRQRGKPWKQDGEDIKKMRASLREARERSRSKEPIPGARARSPPRGREDAQAEGSKRRSLTFTSDDEAEDEGSAPPRASLPKHTSFPDHMRRPHIGTSDDEGHPSKLSKRIPRRSTWSETAKEWGRQRWSKEEGEETMSATAFVVNIVADLCPSGFLSIAYGMDGTGYIWSIVIMCIFYALCVYTMWCCGRTCEISGEADFASQWALVIGPGGSWIPLLVIVIVSFGALLCYACYFGDLLEEVMPAIGLHLPRYACLISFSLFPALPLCLLKNLSALAYSSFFAFMALIYTAVVMVVRLADGSYAEGGRFVGDLREDLLPNMPQGNYLLAIGARSLLYINILAMAFHCHCNACKYYRELKGVTPRHFRNCTIVAMGVALVLYAVIGCVGFKTFGRAASGTILKNYSLEDMPVNVARILISLSLVASYAIMFSALREAFIGLLKHVGGTSMANSLDLVWRQDVLSGVLVALVTICGVVSKDSGLVDGFVGAFCGNAIIYIIPCLLYTAAVKSFLDKRRNRPGLAFSSFLVVLGVLLAIAGCVCLICFEVEAEPERPVQHHWKWDPSDVLQPQVSREGSEKHELRRPAVPTVPYHHHMDGTRPFGRHIWSMR